MSTQAFFAIAHNPNSIARLRTALDEGANAIEPDVYFNTDTQQYEMTEVLPLWGREDKNALSLQQYLSHLADVMGDTPQIAWICFDLKNPESLDINHFFEITRQTIRTRYPKLLISATVAGSDSIHYLLPLQSPHSNYEAIGVDQSVHAVDAYAAFKDSELNYTYGTGNSFWPTTLSGYVKDIAKALEIKRSTQNSFQLVYAWTVNLESRMRLYLNMGVDAMITDNVARLVGLVSSVDYNTTFHLARYGEIVFSSLDRRDIQAKNIDG